MKKGTFHILILLVLPQVLGDPQLHIWNGLNVNEGRHFVTQIFSPSQNCTSTLIQMDPPVIFCAQHCVQENNIAKYQVRLGHYVWEAGLCGEIQRIAKMPGYVKGEKNDFAIVVLHHISEKYHFMIESIELATEAPALETEHELLGYGKTRPEAENTRLAYGLTKLKNVFEELLYFEDKEIGGTQRDSGGPIVDIHGKLVGVIVQGQKNPKKPPVRTIGININDVNVRKFIKDNVPPKNV